MIRAKNAEGIRTNGGIPPSVLKLSNTWGYEVSFNSRPIDPQQGATVLLNGEAVGPQSQSGHNGKDKSLIHAGDRI